MLTLLKKIKNTLTHHIKNKSYRGYISFFTAQFLKWFLLIFLALFTLLPLIWIIISSFKTNMEIFTTAIALPKAWQIQNYKNAFGLDGLLEAFRNTIFVSAASTAMCVLITSMAAYALRYKFRYKKQVYFFLIIGMYIPVNAFMIPYFTISAFLKIYNTVWSLMLVYTAVGLPISILILKGYMDTIPNEILESARIDGCSFFKTYKKIMFPLSVPGIATVGVFQFISAWNEFLFATILTSNKGSRTLQVSIRYFMGTFVVDYASAFATMVITLIPTIMIYIFFQERIIAGLTSGAVKG